MSVVIPRARLVPTPLLDVQAQTNAARAGNTLIDLTKQNDPTSHQCTVPNRVLRMVSEGKTVMWSCRTCGRVFESHHNGSVRYANRAEALAYAQDGEDRGGYSPEHIALVRERYRRGGGLHET